MYRLKKYKKGWIVEKKIYKWHLFYGITHKWTHTTHYAGLKDSPFYYKQPQNAIEGSLKDLKENIIIEYKQYL